MAEKRNDFTITTLKLVDTLEKGREEAEKAKVAPFMGEYVPLRDARARWEHMAYGERLTYIRGHGVDAALKLVRPPKGGGFMGADGTSLASMQGEE